MDDFADQGHPCLDVAAMLDSLLAYSYDGGQILSCIPYPGTWINSQSKENIY